MIARTSRTVIVTRAAASAAVASVLLLTGCESAGSGQDAGADGTESAAAEQTAGSTEAAATEEPTEPAAMTTSGALVDDFPAAVKPLEDAEIVYSSVEPGEEGEAVKLNLTMRTEMSESDVLKFYAKTLEEAGFEPTADASSADGITKQTYHADEASQLLAVTINADPNTDGALLVSVGGTALP
ncbi:hypothetical protein [Brevibacterium salitolerans]